MALVDFTKLPLYEHDYESYEPPIFTQDVVAGFPDGSWTGTIYNAIWGYFTFQQTIRFDYKKSDRYMSKGIFSIEGVFTVNAEYPPNTNTPDNLDENVPEDEEVRFNKLKVKYDALRGLLHLDCIGCRN